MAIDALISLYSHNCCQHANVEWLLQENPPFSKDVRCAQFYYVDKFILLVSGNSFYLYKYHIDPTREDIKRLVSPICLNKTFLSQ